MGYNKCMYLHRNRSAFTLIELLVVIAITAILAVVVILIINPTELLRQGRDVTRATDMSTINKAVSLYYQDAMNNPSTLFMGTSSVIYISIPDSAATSTVGDQCQGLNLPTAPTGYTYHCAASSTYMKVNGTGWIPINFNSYSAGSVISKLPVDPVNTTSTNLYYTYETDGIGGFKVAAFFESQKDAPQMANDSGDDPELYEKGSNLALAAGRGLMGYWPMDEGTGSSAMDYSGSNATGVWNGTSAGTNGYYSVGKVGAYSGTFNGSNNYVLDSSNNADLALTKAFTLMAWVKLSASSTDEKVISKRPSYQLAIYSNNIPETEVFIGGTSEDTRSASGGTVLTNGVWYQIVGTYDGTTLKTYVNGSLDRQLAISGAISTTTYALNLGKTADGAANYFNGLIDDARVYNYALPATEIQEMYNAEK
jgi:prepilin-type N-terminal cleavage/methylation domain-containing protein